MMAKYTTEVRTICETFSGLSESVGYASVDEVISKARNKVFDFQYPIFDENYREALESKILLTFYTREIGFETVGLWKLKLKTKLNQIMPYYNQLYKSELLQFNPFYDTELNRQHTNKLDGTHDSKTDYSSENSSNSASGVNGSSTNTSHADTTTTNGGTTNSLNLYSDTPQGAISNLKDMSYLTNASDTTDTIDTTSTGEDNTTSTNEHESEETSNTQANTIGESKNIASIKNKVSYVINEDTGKFHLSTCRFVKQMNEENKVISSKSRDILIKEGYEACKVCKP